MRFMTLVTGPGAPRALFSGCDHPVSLFSIIDLPKLEHLIIWLLKQNFPGHTFATHDQKYVDRRITEGLTYYTHIELNVLESTDASFDAGVNSRGIHFIRCDYVDQEATILRYAVVRPSLEERTYVNLCQRGLFSLFNIVPYEFKLQATRFSFTKDFKTFAGFADRLGNAHVDARKASEALALMYRAPAKFDLTHQEPVPLITKDMP